MVDDDREGRGAVVQGPSIDNRFIEGFEIAPADCKAAANHLFRDVVASLAYSLSNASDGEISRGQREAVQSYRVARFSPIANEPCVCPVREGRLKGEALPFSNSVFD